MMGDVTPKRPPFEGRTWDPADWYAGRLPIDHSGNWYITCAELTPGHRTCRDARRRGIVEREGRHITMLVRQDPIPGYEAPPDAPGPANGRVVVMSDAHTEIEESKWLWEHATGRVLINGLGMGITVRMALANPAVTHIDVVEKSRDVLALCWDQFDDDPRVTPHLADAHTICWPEGHRWNVVWNDIWDTPDAVTTWGGVLELWRKYECRADLIGSWPENVRQFDQRAVHHILRLGAA